MNPKKYIKSPFVLAVLDYFKANPDEELLNDDVEAKFGKPLKRSIYEELRPAVKDGLLKTRKEKYSLVYSIGDESLLDALLATDDADTRTLPLPLPERDPQGLSQHAPGAKLDAGKTLPALVLLDFAHALNAVAEVGTAGAIKYSESGWLQVKDGEKRYENAMMRHFLKKGMGESVDLDSGQLHQAHLAWNALATLELMLRRPASHASIITPAARERMDSAQ